jgi:hypothetical protein
VAKSSAAARKNPRKRHHRFLWFEWPRWGRGAKLPISKMQLKKPALASRSNRDEKKLLV